MDGALDLDELKRLLAAHFTAATPEERNQIRRKAFAALPDLIAEIERLREEVTICRGASHSPHDVKRIECLEVALREKDAIIEGLCRDTVGPL